MRNNKIHLDRSISSILCSLSLIASIIALSISNAPPAQAATQVTFCASGCDYNNLQKAINLLPSGGGTVIIKDGTYQISSTITLKSDVRLEFSSKAIIKFMGSSKPIFKGTDVVRVTIKGGTIITENSGVKAIAFWDSKSIVVDRTKIQLVKGSNSNAFYCVDCINVYLNYIEAKSASRLVDIKSESRTTDGKSRNIWIRGGIFDNSAIEGIKVNYSVDVHIIDNKISNTAENGIDIGYNKNSEVKSNRLIRTGVPNGAAIHTDSTRGADVIGNYVDTTGQTAIPVYRAYDVDVIDNTIINAGKQGISVITKSEPSSYVKVSSNHIISPADHGIYVSPSQNHVEISYNTLEGIPDDKKAILIGSSNPTVKLFGNKII
jgi:hypothetical protein